MKNDELTVRTPLGELVVGIKADPDYPGISVAFCGNGMNDCFNEGSIRLAWIEYSPEKRRLQAIVYGDGNADDYTQLIEFKNISDQDKYGKALTWVCQDGVRGCRIYDKMTEVSITKEDDWDAMVTFHTQQAKKLLSTMQPYLI